MTDKEYVICEKEDLVAIADAVRAKSGSTESLTVEGLSTAVSNVGSGGGAAIETATVEVYDLDGVIHCVCAVVYQNNKPMLKTLPNGEEGEMYIYEATIENVVKGSYIVVQCGDVALKSITGATEISCVDYSIYYQWVFEINDASVRIGLC